MENEKSLLCDILEDITKKLDELTSEPICPDEIITTGDEIFQIGFESMTKIFGTDTLFSHPEIINVFADYTSLLVKTLVKKDKGESNNGR